MNIFSFFNSESEPEKPIINRRVFLVESATAACGLMGLTLLHAEPETPKLSHTAHHLGDNVWRTVVAHYDHVNGNRRLYPKAVLEAAVKQVKSAIDNRGLVGEFECSYESASIIHFNNASHLVKDLFSEGEYLVADIEPLNTPMGKYLLPLLEKNLVAFRTRGVGSGKVDENAILHINDSYKLITIDAMLYQSASAL